MRKAYKYSAGRNNSVRMVPTITPERLQRLTFITFNAGHQIDQVDIVVNEANLLWHCRSFVEESTTNDLRYGLMRRRAPKDAPTACWDTY